MIKLSLAQRIRYSLILVSTLSALLFSIIAQLFIESFEDNTLKAHLRNDLQHYIQQYKNHNDDVALHTPDAYFLKFSINDLTRIDEELRNLNEGEHEIVRPYGEDMVFVKDINQKRYILMSKQESFEQFESISSITLMIATASVLLLSLIVSFLLGKRILKPITQLTQTLKEKNENQFDHQALNIIDQHDEVGFLVHSFNQYLNKITQLLQREQLFTSDISHELRTPLMIIKSSVELLHSQPDPSKQSELLIKIDSSVNEIQELIDTFLSLAREKNQHQSNVITQRADRILLKRLEYWQAYANNQGIAIHSHIDDPIQAVFSVPLLSTVISNLIKNALLHSHSKQIDIYLSNTHIKVQDHGPKISDELQSVLFDAFQKGDPLSSGLGLGLSIIKRICEHQQWQVRYEYDEDQGSAFIIEFNV
jgi:signal transduction histidine kinase